MLVISRRPKEKVLFPDLGITVEVLSVKSGVVRLGIQAPDAVAIFRDEVWRRTRQWADADPPSSPSQKLTLAALRLSQVLAEQKGAPSPEVQGLVEELLQEIGASGRQEEAAAPAARHSA
jgi:carbon storage regulator CsrA